MSNDVYQICGGVSAEKTRAQYEFGQVVCEVWSDENLANDKPISWELHWDWVAAYWSADYREGTGGRPNWDRKVRQDVQDSPTVPATREAAKHGELRRPTLLQRRLVSEQSR